MRRIEFDEPVSVFYWEFPSEISLHIKHRDKPDEIIKLDKPILLAEIFVNGCYIGYGIPEAVHRVKAINIIDEHTIEHVVLHIHIEDVNICKKVVK